MPLLQNFDPQCEDQLEEMKKEMNERARRALAAYWRNPGYDHPHPPTDVTHFETNGHEYVGLSSKVAGTVAVYRIRRDGQLKRLKRLPDPSGARIFVP